MIRVINEYDGSKVYTIEKQCKTYGQVMQALELEGVKTSEIQLCARADVSELVRLDDREEIDWNDQDVIELYAYEREYIVRVVCSQDVGAALVDQTETFNLLKNVTIGEIRDIFERKHGPGSLPELFYGERLDDRTPIGTLGPEFLDNPVLIGKLTVDVADEKCNQIRHMAVPPNITVGVIWKSFMRNATPPRVMHTREGGKGKPLPLCREDCGSAHCPHTWLSYGGKLLEADDRLCDATHLGPDEYHRLLYYNPPPFSVVIKEKNEKNEIIETKIEIEDWNTIAEVRNKYSRNAEEGLVDGDLLLLDDQELKEERMVFTYAIRRESSLFVQKRSANQPMFTYTCADCGNDLRLRKDEKIRCRECGHRVVYKPRLNKPLQHFAR